MMNNGSYEYKANNKSQSLPKKFNSVCVDDFFSDPDLIRNFGLSIKKNPSIDGKWPGLRTPNLWEINSIFHNQFLLKVFSAYFDLRYTNVKWKNSNVHFQQVKKFDSDENNVKNCGWIHRDSDTDLAGLVYLTKNPNLNSGTSLFELKKDTIYPQDDGMFFQTAKEDLYKNNITVDDYEKKWQSWNNLYYEKTIFKNVYNRLIAYDGQELHRANNFFNENEDRLTLVFFVKGVTTSVFPLDRVYEKNFDNSFEEQINLFNKNENIKSTIIKSEETDISDK
jgi:hypothetical protein